MTAKSTPRTPQAAPKANMMPNNLPSESEIPVAGMRLPAKIKNAARRKKTISMRNVLLTVAFVYHRQTTYLR
jgi:hypothetical protein